MAGHGVVKPQREPARSCSHKHFGEYCTCSPYLWVLEVLVGRVVEQRRESRRGARRLRGNRARQLPVQDGKWLQRCPDGLLVGLRHLVELERLRLRLGAARDTCGAGTISCVYQSYAATCLASCAAAEAAHQFGARREVLEQLGRRLLDPRLLRRRSRRRLPLLQRRLLRRILSLQPRGRRRRRRAWRALPLLPRAARSSAPDQPHQPPHHAALRTAEVACARAAPLPPPARWWRPSLRPWRRCSPCRCRCPRRRRRRRARPPRRRGGAAAASCST
jgi:hypothetical protein